MMDQSDWIIGRKAILKAVNRTCWGTICKWRREYGLVLTRTPSGSPAILRSTLTQWLLSYKSQRKYNLRLD